MQGFLSQVLKYLKVTPLSVLMLVVLTYVYANTKTIPATQPGRLN